MGTDVGDTCIQHQLCALNRTHGCCCLLGVSSLCLLPREVLGLIARCSREGWAAFGRMGGLLSPRHMSAPTCIFSVFINISGAAQDNSAWQMSQFTTSPLNCFTFRRCNFVFFPITSCTCSLEQIGKDGIARPHGSEPRLWVKSRLCSCQPYKAQCPHLTDVEDTCAHLRGPVLLSGRLGASVAPCPP